MQRATHFEPIEASCRHAGDRCSFRRHGNAVCSEPRWRMLIINRERASRHRSTLPRTRRVRLRLGRSAPPSAFQHQGRDRRYIEPTPTQGTTSGALPVPGSTPSDRACRARGYARARRLVMRSRITDSTGRGCECGISAPSRCTRRRARKTPAEPSTVLALERRRRETRDWHHSRSLGERHGGRARGHAGESRAGAQ